jgi:hypothetical protein
MKHEANLHIKDNKGITPLLYTLDTYMNITNKILKIWKYFFQYGAILDELPETMNKDRQKKHYKSLQICWKWWTIKQIRGQELIDIPIEVFYRGSKAIDIYFNEIDKYLSKSNLCSWTMWLGRNKSCEIADIRCS